MITSPPRRADTYVQQQRSNDEKDGTNRSSTLKDGQSNKHSGDENLHLRSHATTCSTQSSPFRHGLPGNMRREEGINYRGISMDIRGITKRGVSRGNHAELKADYWLEVADKRHRYGTDLILYYRHWESLGFPKVNFFEWLDAIQPRPPDLEDCPRSKLDNGAIDFIVDMNVTRQYALTIHTDDKGQGIIVDTNGDLLQTGHSNWIYVLRDDVLYGHKKVKKRENNADGHNFAHSSFFGGRAVAAAGYLSTDESGTLKSVSATSGHYKPIEADFQRFLDFLHRAGVNLQTIDTRLQDLKYFRENFKGNVQWPMKASLAACYLDNYLANATHCVSACEIG